MWTACPAPPRPAPLTSPGNRCPQARTIVSAAPFRYQQRLENQTAICGSFANLPYPDFVPPYIELFGNASNPDTPTDDIIGKFRGAIKAAIDTVHALKGAKEFPRASVILAKHLRDIHEGINLANATKDQIIAAIKLCGRKYQALGEIVQRGGKEVLAAALKDCNAAIDAENAAAAARFKALRGDVENPILLFTKRMNEKKFNIKTVTSEQLRDIFGEIINMFAKSATDVVDKHKDLFKYVFLYMTPAIIDEIVKIYKTGEWTDFIGDLADGTSEEEKVTENALEKRQTEIFARLLEEFGGGDGGGGGGGGGVRVKETERQTDKEGRKVMEIVRREEAKKEAKPKVSKDTEEDVALVRNETKVASASLRKFIQTCYQESICMNFLGLCDQWSIL